MGAFKDLSGLTFGRLTAKGRTKHDKHGVWLWEWQCACGKRIERPALPIVSGRQVSCGCHRDEQSRARAKHGYAGTRTYRAWIDMRARVEGKDDTARRHYTERGITVHPSWQQFEAFLADMGECPPGLSLDRENNDGNYEPGNCRWASQRQQVANTRRTVWVLHEGKPAFLKHACAQAAKNYDRVRSRIRLGMAPQDAFDRG